MAEKKKGANGTMSVYEYRGGYRGAVTLDGRKVYRKGRTKKTVREALDEVKRQHSNTGVVGNARLTLKDHLTAWVKEHERTLKPETARKYRQHVDGHLVPRLGSKRLAVLQPADIRRLHRDMAADGLSGTTIFHVHSTLRTALNAALADGLVPRNVASLVPTPKRSTQEQNWLTPEEVRELTSKVAGTPDEARVLVALLGLRQGEALGLRWDDIDLDAETLTVRNSLTRTPKGLALTPPKTAKSRRTIGLPPQVVEALRGHRGASTGSFVFSRPDGSPTHPSSDARAWAAALDRAGVRHVRLHDGRHSAATAMLAAGTDPLDVARHLGHASVSMVYSRYGHQADEMRQRTTTATGRALFG